MDRVLAQNSDHALETLRGVWELHPDEEYRRDQSHWLGHGRWTPQAWSALGEAVRSRTLDLLRTTGWQVTDDPHLRILEWGPGGGANLVALSPFARALIGVEISTKNLEECAKQLDRIGHVDFLPIELAGPPATVATELGQPIDVFVSQFVFHVLPSRDYGREVLRTAFAIMRPGAVGYVQIRFDDGTPRYRSRPVSSYATSHTFATSWPVTEFWAELEATGFSPIKIANLNLRANFASFYFQK